MFQKDLDIIDSIFNNAVKELKDLCVRYADNTIITDNEEKGTLWLYMWSNVHDYTIDEKEIKAIKCDNDTIFLYDENDNSYPLQDSNVFFKPTILSIMYNIKYFID